MVSLIKHNFFFKLWLEIEAAPSAQKAREEKYCCLWTAIASTWRSLGNST
jgi:hypothetical protein